MEPIDRYDKNKLLVNDLATVYRLSSYQELVDKVRELEQKERIEPIKSRGLNGKKPALYQAYRIIRKIEHKESFREELLYLHPRLASGYYLKNIEKYKEDRQYVLQLNEFLKEEKYPFVEAASYNERSFEVFHREKFLTKEGGIRILANLGLTMKDLNCYETTEPLAYYSFHNRVPQIVVFIENKDTYYTLRRKLLSGDNRLFGQEVGTVIYGAGKGLYRSILDLKLCAEEHVGHDKNEFLYFGDLDYEGILIYETVAEKMEDSQDIKPFVKAYERMLEKAEEISLPATKEKQNRGIGQRFFSYFPQKQVEQMKQILEREAYIPQEIIQTNDL